MNGVYPMVLKIISAFIMPGLLVLLFARVTYNRLIGLVLTVALIAGSVYKGYTHPYSIIIIDAFSLTVGFWLAAKMKPSKVVKKG